MTKTINISLTNELLAQIDQVTKALYATRSAYIRHAVIEQLRLDRQDQTVRRTMAKQLPQKHISKSMTDEFDLSDDYSI